MKTVSKVMVTRKKAKVKVKVTLTERKMGMTQPNSVNELTTLERISSAVFWPERT